MNVDVVPVDSKAWGRVVLSLSDVVADDDVLATEAAYLRCYHPAYVSVRLPLDDLGSIHRFELAGFSLVECQLRMVARFKVDYDVSAYSYEYTQVETDRDLDKVLSIARYAISHDRFSIDQAVPEGFSGRRYEAYVRQSFVSPHEEVWRLHDVRDDLTLAFRTLRRINSEECLLLLGGVRPDFQSLGIGVVASHYCFNQMRRDGIRRAFTHISAGNRPIFNLEASHFGFRLQQAYAVLRKLYP